MAESNKVVLKINYQSKKNKTQPKMVVEWNIKRILLALVLLILLLIISIYFFLSETPETQKVVTIDGQSKQTLNQPVDNSIKFDGKMELGSKIKSDSKLSIDDRIVQLAKENGDKKAASVNSSKLKINKQLKAKKSVSEAKAISKEFKDNRIVRALLTSALNNKEPVDIMTIPIRVNSEGARSVIYFTEIINMKGKVLYHHWLRNNKVLFKRKINIFGNRWRAATSKLIIVSQVGLWNVRLVNEEGIVLNEIQFDVIKE